MEILNNKSEDVISFLAVLDDSLDSINLALASRTPHLKGEKYLTNNAVSKLLNISIRSLHQLYSDFGKDSLSTVRYSQIIGG